MDTADLRRREIEIVQLQTELSPIWREGFEVWGHGTNLTDAQKILSDGFESRSPDLAPRTITITNKKTDMEMVMNWPHNKAKVIIIFLVPASGVPNPDMILWQYDSEKGVSKIAPDKIPGYIDVSNLKFINSPKFTGERLS